jgi:hypothetical protein
LYEVRLFEPGGLSTNVYHVTLTIRIGNKKGRTHLHDLREDGRVILIMDLKEIGSGWDVCEVFLQNSPVRT